MLGGPFNKAGAESRDQLAASASVEAVHAPEQAVGSTTVGRVKAQEPRNEFWSFLPQTVIVVLILVETAQKVSPRAPPAKVEPMAKPSH